MSDSFNRASYKRNLARREQRKNEPLEADTLIKDIRLYFTYAVPPELHYLYTYSDVILRLLQQKQLLCPGYSHLYIKIGLTEEEAIASANEVEPWFRCGIAVLRKEKFFDAAPGEKEELILQAITDGLHDLARLDKLDITKIDEAITQARAWGVIHERVLNQKENRKYLFCITAKPIAGSKLEEICFSLTDRDGQQQYKWKFGELNIWDAAAWFHKVNVTNKLIRTKPAARMDLVLMGKKMELELSIEKIKDGTGQITADQATAPITERQLELSKMVEKALNGLNIKLQAMIFAAGLGTRFKPWTDQHPKALAVINGKSLLQRNVEYLQQYGIRNVVVNVHHFADQVRKAVEENKGWGSEIMLSDETQELLETGGGLKKALPHLNANTVVVINSDILTDMDLGKMIAFHQQHQSLATLAVSDRETSRYFLFNEKNILCGWRNTKTGEEKISRKATEYIQKAFSGIHIIETRFINLVKREGKFSMVDVYLDLAAGHEILAFDHTGSRFIDVGKPEAVASAESMFP